jgi:hypothetical protein
LKEVNITNYIIVNTTTERPHRNHAVIHQQPNDGFDESLSEKEADTSNFLPPDAQTELLP